MEHFNHIGYSDINNLIRALTLLQEQKWEAAHNIAQSKEGFPAYDRIHALLHRVEGDDFNARYWYRKIGSKLPSKSCAQETEELLEVLKNKL